MIITAKIAGAAASGLVAGLALAGALEGAIVVGGTVIAWVMMWQLCRAAGDADESMGLEDQ